MLIEAKDLVNGVSIVQAEHVDKVKYVHIELDSHDVIVAEGALSETFIDDDSRGMFHNAHEYRRALSRAAAAAGAVLRAPSRRTATRSKRCGSALRPCRAAAGGRRARRRLRGYVDRGQRRP